MGRPGAILSIGERPFLVRGAPDDMIRLLRHGLSMLLCLAAAGVSAAQVPAQKPKASPAEAGKAFRAVFQGEMETAEQVKELERIVKEYPETGWDDDALWVLGEVARQDGRVDRVLYYWQYLMTRPVEPKLEEYTRTLVLYRKSSLYRVQFLLEAEGNAYVRPAPGEPTTRQAFSLVATGPSHRGGERIMLGCRRFNAVPMVVWAELGDCYERMGLLAAALRAHRKSVELSPEKGRWHKNYSERVARLEAKLNLKAGEEVARATASDARPEAVGERGATLAQKPVGSREHSEKRESSAAVPDDERADRQGD